MVISPYLAAGACRFTPSCADYASQAITAHGAVRGSWLAARRLARCRPWGGHGFDPIPPGSQRGPRKHRLASQRALETQSPAAR